MYFIECGCYNNKKRKVKMDIIGSFIGLGLLTLIALYLAIFGRVDRRR